MRPTAFASLLLFFLAWCVSGLEVSPDSPCAAKCLDDPRIGNASNPLNSFTFGPDLPCYDWQFSGPNSTQVGRKFADCNDCQKASGHLDPITNERDVGWFLFNNRAVVDWCVFGRFGDEINTRFRSERTYEACNAECDPIFASTDVQIKTNPQSYSFCDYDGDFEAIAQKCTSCLYKQEGLTILGNVLSTVQDMCLQKPGRNYTFPHNQEIYNASRVLLPATQIGDETSASDHSSTSGLSIGAIVGVIIGSLTLITMILLILLFMLHQRKMRQQADVVIVKDITYMRDDESITGQQMGVAYPRQISMEGHKDMYAHMASRSLNLGSPAELAARKSMIEMCANQTVREEKNENDYGP